MRKRRFLWLLIPLILIAGGAGYYFYTTQASAQAGDVDGNVRRAAVPIPHLDT